MTSNAADWAAVLGLILGGCCSNVFSLEVLIRQAPASGHLITLAQFTLVALEGLYSHLHWIRWKSRRSLWDHICPLRLKPRSVPLYHWLAMVSLFWGVSVLNNYALAFDIPMPFHIVFRSAGLVMSLVMSWAVFGKRYSWSQIGAVLTVSIGILLATLASSNSGNTSILPVLDSAKWVTGIGILVLALFLSAVMGQYQQYLYSTFGRDWREGLFYTHFLALPAFALMSSSISQEYIRYSEAPRIYPFESLLSHSLTSDLPWIQPLSNLSISYLWFYLLLNVLTQYGCIAGVQKLSSMSNAVTLNLILSLRKFTSLVISITLFKNVFTLNHWIGTILVFVGTIWYSLSSSGAASKTPHERQSRAKKSKEKKDS